MNSENNEPPRKAQLPLSHIIALCVTPDVAVHVWAAGFLCFFQDSPLWLSVACIYSPVVWVVGLVLLVLVGGLLALYGPEEERWRRIKTVCAVLVSSHLLVWLLGIFVLTVRFVGPEP